MVTLTSDAFMVEITEHLAKEVQCMWWGEGSVDCVLAVAWDVELGDRDSEAATISMFKALCSKMSMSEK